MIPCPCGSADLKLIDADLGGGHFPHVGYAVQCAACGRKGPFANSPAEAVTRWDEPRGDRHRGGGRAIGPVNPPQA